MYISQHIPAVVVLMVGEVDDEEKKSQMEKSGVLSRVLLKIYNHIQTTHPQPSQ